MLWLTPVFRLALRDHPFHVAVGKESSAAWDRDERLPARGSYEHSAANDEAEPTR
jgi:hypothetical protein